jgi:hypothetical protein
LALCESEESAHARVELIWTFLPKVAARFQQDKLHIGGPEGGQGLLDQRHTSRVVLTEQDQNAMLQSTDLCGEVKSLDGGQGQLIDRAAEFSPRCVLVWMIEGEEWVGTVGQEIRARLTKHVLNRARRAIYD